VTLAVDSSVTIAALLADHSSHDSAEAALARSTSTIWHVAAETYSVLTRLPGQLRLDAATAADLVAARLPTPNFALGESVYVDALDRLAAAHVSGGATYDGLIALTAIEHELALLSRDRRAARTYRALGVRFELIED
jgi:toxin FitB